MSDANPTESAAWELRTVSLDLPTGSGAAVEGVAVDGRRIYLTHYLFTPPNPLASSTNGKLVVLDADTLVTLAEIPVGIRPRSVAVNPQTNRIYVVNSGPSTPSLSVIDSVNLTELARIPLSSAPTRVAVSPRNNRVYVTHSSPGAVTVLNGANNTVAANVAVGNGATGVAVDDALNRVYITVASTTLSGRLVVIDAATHQIQRTLTIPPERSTPNDVTYLPESNRLYVANLGLGPGSGSAPAPRLTVLTRSDFAPVTEIPLPANATHLAANRANQKVYAATSAGLIVIDTMSNRVETTVTIDRPILGIAVALKTEQVVAGDPAGGLAIAAHQPRHPFGLTLLRPDDLLYLHFDFEHLELVTEGGRPRLVRKGAEHPAFVVVHFPPQSLAEQTPGASPGGAPPPIKPPLRGRISGRSQLAFFVPDAITEIPYTVQGLLDWSSWQPSLVPVALPRGTAQGGAVPPRIVSPSSQTAIELPYRLMLSPDNKGAWEHAREPVRRGDRTELWHTRLINGQQPRQDPDARAIWSPDMNNASLSSAADAPLSADDRRRLVRQTSDFTLAQYRPEPVEVDELMLTALGGFLRVRGAWNNKTVPELNLAAWRQRTTLGRDHYVMVTERGMLFPFGHRAIRVKVSEREITGSPPVAALRTRDYIVVTEPVKTYDVKSYTHAGRENPFNRRIQILTTVTPDDVGFEAVKMELPPQQPPLLPAQWVGTANAPFYFDLVAQDAGGGRAALRAQLIFITDAQQAAPGFMNALQAAYTTKAGARRTIEAGGQSITFAASTNGAGQLTRATAEAPGGVPDLGLATEQLVFKTQAILAVAGQPRFLPVLERAAVRIPAVEQLAGTARTATIELYDQYLAGAQNEAAVFARFIKDDGSRLPDALSVGLPAEKAGGLANAALTVTGISERLGPVVGDLQSLAKGRFDINSLARLADSKLLGTIALKDLIEPITDPGRFDAQLPRMRTEVERDAASGAPRALIHRMEWSPRIKNVDPFFKAKLGDKQATLVISSRLQQRLSGVELDGEPDYEIKGVLSNFHIDFLDVLEVNFRQLEFRSVKGKKPIVNPVLANPAVDQIRPIVFRGPLEFLDKLREYIPFDGFSDPPALDITSNGVNVSYSLGLPPLSFGVFNLQNVTLGAGLTLPFVNAPARMRFNFSERHNPFQLTVMALGGGGFFALDVALNRIVAIEAALEFGAAVAIDLGVARGSLYVMGGIYFALRTDPENDKSSTVELTAYLRAGGSLSVLGLVSVSTEFYMSLTYDSRTRELRGQATVTCKVRIAFFSKTVSITLKRRFAGPSRGDAARTLHALEDNEAALAAAAPSFGDGMTETDWRAYAGAFA
jgi:YVTN family beta-propeller protein